MKKTVLDVGNCRADHGAIAGLLRSKFGVEVLRATSADETLDVLRSGGIDLVLVNRVFEADGSEGIDLIRRIKGDGSLAGVPVMLVSNFPECQDAAVAAGAQRGFGKAELRTPATAGILQRFLAPQ